MPAIKPDAPGEACLPSVGHPSPRGISSIKGPIIFLKTTKEVEWREEGELLLLFLFMVLP